MLCYVCIGLFLEKTNPVVNPVVASQKYCIYIPLVPYISAGTLVVPRNRPHTIFTNEFLEYNNQNTAIKILNKIASA